MSRNKRTTDCPGLRAWLFDSLYYYAPQFRVNSDHDFIARFEGEEPVAGDLCRYVNKELVINTFSCSCWPVHESALPLKQSGVPFWYHNRTSAMRVSGTQFAIPLWYHNLFRAPLTFWYTKG